MVSTGQAPAYGAAATDAWRTRDIVVTAVIGVAFGVVFWFWNTIWAPLDGVFALAPWAKDLLYAVWLIPAVLAPLIVRKRGAAIFAEMTAAGVSALLGSQWGPDVLLSGFVQGAAAELVFAMHVLSLVRLPDAGRRCRGQRGRRMDPRLGAVLRSGRPPGPARPRGDDGDLGRDHRGRRLGADRALAAPVRRAPGLPGLTVA